jgi:hypothetical protein
VIGTDEFESLGRLESKARGIPDLPIAITKHPIGGLKPDQVRAKAAAMVEATVKAVATDGSASHAAG